MSSHQLSHRVKKEVLQAAGPAAIRSKLRIVDGNAWQRAGRSMLDMTLDALGSEGEKMPVQLADVFKHADNIVVRKVMDETLLVPISGELASMDNLYALNETGAFVWQALDGVSSLAQIARQIEQLYDGPSEAIEADVLELVEGLSKAALIRQQVE